MTSIVTPTAIPEHATALPDAADEATFDTRSFSLYNYLVGTMAPGANTLSSQCYSNALVAMESAEMAKAAANFAGDWADLTGALSMPASVFHAGQFWALRNDLANVATSTPSGVSTDWAAIGPIDAAGLSYDNSASGLQANNAQAAIDEVFSKTSKPRNIVHNAELRNVFRNGGANPPTTLTAGQFLIDRWKAGASGLTRLPPGTINGQIGWSAGTLVQELKDFGTTVLNPDGLSSGQKVTFAWGGTAVARINGGAWQTSPFTFEAVGAVSSLTLEFGLAGGATSATLSSIRATFGEFDGGFTPIPMSEAEPLLERYFQRVSVLNQFVAGAGAQTEIWTESHARMAAVPTPTYVGSPSYINTTLATLTAGTNNRFYISMPSTAAGAVRLTATVALDTGL